MNKAELLADLSEELELENEVSFETNIKELEEWDSMSAMVLIGFVSESFDMTLNADDIHALTTFQSLIDRIGKDKFSE